MTYFRPISAFIFDVDGVLTDGTLYLTADGEMVRRMNIKDGYALQLAIKKRYRVAVISGGLSEPVRQRLHKLGVQDVFMAVHDKRQVLQEYMRQHGLVHEAVLFMGDDMPDLDVMGMAGLPCCPADACGEAKAASRYISPYGGGMGCVRDVIEKTMKIQGTWQHNTEVVSR